MTVRSQPCLRIIVFSCVFILVSACSTSTPREYGVSKLADQATHYFEWAEQLRRQESFKEADEKYKHAYSFFIARNDMKWVINCYLKRALIAIKQNRYVLAQQLVEHASLIRQIESVGSQASIDFVQAKLWFAQGESLKAAGLIETLVMRYKDDSEKHAYYLFHLWLYDKTRVNKQQIQMALDHLTQRYDARKLQQVEILMFALNHYAQSGIDELQGKKTTQMSSTTSVFTEGLIEAALLRLINLYGLYEMTAALQRTLNLTREYYEKTGDEVKAKYYRHKFEVLNALN